MTVRIRDLEVGDIVDDGYGEYAVYLIQQFTTRYVNITFKRISSNLTVTVTYELHEEFQRWRYIKKTNKNEVTYNGLEYI